MFLQSENPFDNLVFSSGKPIVNWQINPSTYNVKQFSSNGFNIMQARNLKIFNDGTIYFIKLDPQNMLHFVTLTFAKDFDDYSIEVHQIGMKNFKDYIFVKNSKKTNQQKASGGLLVGVSQFKGLVLLKLLENQSYSVLSSSFKLSFDLAFLFIKGFMTRISLVFLLYWVNLFIKRNWKKMLIKLKVKSEVDAEKDFLKEQFQLRSTSDKNVEGVKVD